jgi:hypothetical protein
MIDIDREVRDSLTRQSAYAPDGADLLAGVHSRSRRYALRRRVVGGGVAAALAVLVAVPLLGQFGRGASTLQPADGKSQLELVPAAPSADRFPLTPGWLPDGLLPPRVIRTSGHEVTALEYQSEVHPYSPVLTFELDTSDPSRYEMDGKPVAYSRRSTTVGGKHAELLTGPYLSLDTALSFQRRPGQWVLITANEAIGTDAVLRGVAANLKDEPITGTMPFEFKLVPKGFTLSQSSAGGAQFEPPADRSFRDAIHVWIDPNGIDPSLREPGPGGSRYTFKEDGNYQAAVRLDHQTALRISAPDEPALSRSDFLRFVDGVKVRLGR